MIRTDYIYDHGLTLPDIVDFPGAGGSLYPDNLPIDLDQMVKVFATHDYESFKKSYLTTCYQIATFVNITDSEEKILQEQMARVLHFVRLYFDSCINQLKRDDIPSTPLYEELNNNGCTGFKINTHEIKSIKDLLGNDIYELQNLFVKDVNPHHYDRFKQYKRADKPRLFEIVDEIFNKRKVFQAVSKYNQNKRNLQLDHIALQIATAADRHHYQTLKDLPTVSKLLSLHMDPKYNLVKSLIYLSDVDKGSGPFTTVQGSNRWYYKPFEKLIACGNSTGNYLNSPAHRKVLRMMPKKMRKNIILGRYILDETPTSKMLLSQLKHWTSDEVDVMIFDPTQTLHRGGLCQSRNRINLQIVMR